MKHLTENDRKKMIKEIKKTIELIYNENEKINNENVPKIIEDFIEKDFLRNHYKIQQQIIFKKLDDFNNQIGNKLIDEKTFMNEIKKIVDDETRKIEQEVLNSY